MEIGYGVAAIDVHKKMLAVVVAEVTSEGLEQLERRKFGAGANQLRELAAWLAEHQVRDVVMESTAQYWKPVWQELEGRYRLSLAQAHSNRAPHGRKRDFADAQRLLRRYVAGELILSFVPEAEQRMWRMMTRGKHQLGRERVRLHNQIESLLEESRIKLSSLVSDLLGVSSRRMLKAVASGETDPAKLAALADRALRATAEQLREALSAVSTLGPCPRQLLGLFLSRLELIESQMDTLEGSIATALRGFQNALVRLAQVPGFGLDSAQQVIAEVGPTAEAFPSPEQLSSWVGVCPGREESAEVSPSDRSPKGNRTMRRVLSQVANAAVKTKGSVFEALYRRLLWKGHNKAIWAVAHKLCRLTWKILRQGVSYIEYGTRLNPKALKKRTNKLIRELGRLGCQVTITLPQKVTG
jgi:transposase